MRHLGTESTPWLGRDLTRPSTHTDTRPPCFEVEKHALRLKASRKLVRALPSDTPGALPPENGFPLNTVRVRGHTDPFTPRKRNGVPLWA